MVWTTHSGVDHRGSCRQLACTPERPCWHPLNHLCGQMAQEVKVARPSPNGLLNAVGFQGWTLQDHNLYYQLNDGYNCRYLPNAIIKWALVLSKQLSLLLLGVMTRLIVQLLCEWSGLGGMGLVFQPLICWRDVKEYLSSTGQGQGKGLQSIRYKGCKSAIRQQESM